MSSVRGGENVCIKGELHTLASLTMTLHFLIILSIYFMLSKLNVIIINSCSSSHAK
jgi:hypothetical protein